VPASRPCRPATFNQSMRTADVSFERHMMVVRTDHVRSGRFEAELVPIRIKDFLSPALTAAKQNSGREASVWQGPSGFARLLPIADSIQNQPAKKGIGQCDKSACSKVRSGVARCRSSSCTQYLRRFIGLSSERSYKRRTTMEWLSGEKIEILFQEMSVVAEGRDSR